MKLAIIGSRGFNDYELLKSTVDAIKNNITLIISGGASGADSLGEKYADEFNIPKMIYYPDWEKYGKMAGYLRNIDIVENADVVLAFWDGKSRGTLHSINLAKASKRTLIVQNYV